MKKNFLIFSALILTFGFHFFPASAKASSDKIEELVKESEDTQTVDHHTLSAPLLSGTFGESGIKGALSLFDLPMKAGSQGNLLYQESEGKTFRLEYENLKDEAAFFLVFDAPMDLRNRWFLLRYRGAKTPSHMKIHFDYDELRADGGFDIYLENSLDPESVYFKLPAKMPFREISSIRFTVDPEELQNSSADFIIEGLDILPQSQDPLAQLPPTDLNRFGWFSNPIEPENQANIQGAEGF